MTTSHAAATHQTMPVLAEVLAERARQDARFGHQNHIAGTGPDLDNPVRLACTVGEAADAARQATDRALSNGTVTFAQILTEEVFKALAEARSDRLRAELVQVAASAVCWIEALDRQVPPRRPAGSTANFSAGDVVRNRYTGELSTVTGDPATWDPYYYVPVDIAGDEIAG